MTMIQYLSDTGHFPGTVHDISMYRRPSSASPAPCRTSPNNHPNDMVSLIMFCSARSAPTIRRGRASSTNLSLTSAGITRG